jgi:hypothetical protein
MGNIPSDIAITLDRIKQEFMRIDLHWRVYRQIFNGPNLQIEMLNVSAPAAFVSLEVALRNEILMSLSRLTDKARTGRSENLTFDKLQEQIESSKDQSLLNKLYNKLTQINQHRDTIHKYRSKQLAHLDFDIETGTVKSPDPITIQQVKETIVAIQDYLSTCQQYYEPASPVIYGYGEEGELLVRFVAEGLRLHELMREGKILRAELHGGRWKDVLKKESNNPTGRKIFRR